MTVKRYDVPAHFDDEVVIKASKLRIVDDTDPTKVMKVVCSSISTGTESSLTVSSQGGLESPEASSDATIGTLGTPASGTLTATFERWGNFFKLNLTLTAARITVSDDGGNGSYGSLKLMDVTEGGVAYLGCRQNYTAYVADGTGVPADAVFEIGVGTTAIATEADGVLASTEDDIGGDVNQTLSGGTTTGTGFTGAGATADGTTTAADINLNWSGTAATIDGAGTIDVTGTICIVGVFLGDD